MSAGCYRSSPAKCAAPGEERRPSAPRTATRAGRRRRTRRAGFFRRRQALRRNIRPKPKLLNQTTQKSPLIHGASRVKTNGLRSSRRTRKDFVRKVPAIRSWTLSVTATKARTLHRRTCGGLGSVDTQC